MSYRFEKTSVGQDLVIEGFEQGIAVSPHKGIANIQGANISTETGEIMASYNRILQLNGSTNTGTLTPLNNSTVSFSTTVPVGSWITINTDSGTGLSGNYYQVDVGKLSQTYARDNTTEINNIIVNATQKVVYLTSGTSWTVPSDWSNISATTFECIGAGGKGGANTGSGGGAGAYSKISNLTFTPGASVSYQVGVAGATDTYFNGASFGAASVAAKGGADGTTGSNATGGQGGQSSAGIGTTKFSGGNGGNSDNTGIDGSGGGAAGPNGAGANGGTGAAGGTADNGLGGAGGTGGTSSPGGNGANGTEYDVSHGSGGGGGASSSTFQNNGNGGLYGGAGAGTVNATPTTGGQGLIRITYFPSTPVTTSATYTVRTMSSPLESATETYYDTSNNVQYRYYILDALGNIWVHDTATLVGVPTPVWFSFFQTLPTNMTAPPSGLAVLNGWLSFSRAFANNSFLFWVSTSVLQGTLTIGTNFQLLSNKTHKTLVGSQNILYYTDGNIIGSVFPNTGPLTSGINIQSYCSYTAPTLADNTLGQISAIIGGAAPIISTTTRVPVVFFTPGTRPAALSEGIIYYIQMSVGTNRNFNVYAAASGGSALDITTGATGPQYFNTFYPLSSAGLATIVVSPQNLFLPFYETAQCLGRLGGTIIIGGSSNTLYSWDGINAFPNDLIPLAENNTTNLITVNNLLYVFAGQKGNIYICNGSSVSLGVSVPDYCAGIPGSPNTYIEPYFSWGGAMYMRGRVWFSILDQTATKAGNCGGIWSFVPTNNLFIGQDTGLSLRQENQSSYGTYNGVCPVLLPNLNQMAIGPQFYSAWYSSITSPSYGIDSSDTIPSPTTVIETDIIPIGTVLNKTTNQQIEYKLAVPLAAGEIIAISYRQNGTDTYVSCGTAVAESTAALAGYFTVNFEKGQWLQLKIIMTPLASTSSSFCRLTQIRIR